MTGLYDIHCHLIPGVDDGSHNMDETIRMLEKEYSEGVRYIMATPHFRYEMFECSMDEIYRRFEEVKQEALEIGDGICLRMGCEFHVCQEMADLLKRGERPSMNNTKYVLTEFASEVEQQQVWNDVYKLVSKGYRPIIAHVERYPAVALDIEFLENLIQLGAEIQVNADSIMGQAGWRVKNLCKKLLKNNLLHYIASDAHNMQSRSSCLGSCAAYIEKKYGQENANRLFRENPAKLFESIDAK